MSLKLVGLQELLDKYTDEQIRDILSQFKSIPSLAGDVNDVEYFLHSKAIQFEKMAISTTYLIFSELEDDIILAGYFSIANKPLTMSKRIFNKLSNSQRKKLTKSGTRTESGDYIINSYLIGQIGKNYSPEAIKYAKITGDEILSAAYDMVLKAKKIVNARYVWLECENNPKLLKFYKNFGFSEVDGFRSENELKVMIMRL